MDNLDNLFAGDIASEPRQAAAHAPERVKTPELFWEPCGKCRGSGQTPWGVCFRCKGTKGKSFRTSASERRARQDADHARRQNAEAAAWRTFFDAEPAAAAWIQKERSSGNSFAESLYEAVLRFGSLSEGRMAAVVRGIERDQARQQERVERVQAAPAVQADLMKEAFDRAAAKGMKRIKVRIAGWTFTPAKAASNNPGAIYAKQGTEYRGKVMDGRFIAVRGVSAEEVAEVTRIIADPKTAARAFGLKSGICSCCGRELTDPVSIENGIGPVCAENYGW
jgi:hypothetical protein